MQYHVVKYTGPFGFIKPWTAVRDSETFSQQFLTPSVLAGMERKLFPELLHEPFGIYRIKRHRLAYQQISMQQEQVQPRGWNKVGRQNERRYERPYAVMTRGVLLHPTLQFAFDNRQNAETAFAQHICLGRNEDILFPEDITETTEEAFDNDEEHFAGFELVLEKNEKAFLVGYNRYNEGELMYGWLKTLGNPVKAF